MRAILLLLAACGCGLGAGEGGGDENLPVSGAGPYRKITDFELLTPLEEPFVIADPAANLTDPCAVPLTGGAARVFYTRGGNEIWRSDLSTLTILPGDAALALAPAEAWEDGRVSAPSIVQHDGRFFMYYQGGATGVGRAESSDGLTWTRSGRVLENGASPTVVILPGDGGPSDLWYLYVTRPTGIHLAVSADGLTFEELPAPVLTPRPGRFDAAAVTDPQATGGRTPAGALHVALFFTGRNAAGLSATGYAGSDDGITFIARTVPILEPGAPAERAPSALLAPTSGILFFGQDRSGKSAIAAATAP